MSAWKKSRSWLERHGFSASILLAAAGAIALGLATKVPESLPGPALGSVALYRVEVMGLSYFIFYFLLISFVLSLRGRGFVQLGPRGVKAGQVLQTKQQVTLKKQTKAIDGLRLNLSRNTALTQVAILELREEIEEVKQRLDKLDNTS